MRNASLVLGSVLLVALLSWPAGGCATTAAGGRVYVSTAPPPPVAEARGIAPGPGHVWVAGFYRWNQTRYVWVPGRWTAPPRPKAVWVPGHWQRTSRGYHWVEGRWR